MVIEENRVMEIASLPYKTHVEMDTCGDVVCFVAYNDELDGCMAQGATWQEAVKSLADARHDYIAASLEHGLDVPRPQQLPVNPVSILESPRPATHNNDLHMAHIAT
ncbi:MAG: type II toxin-antitoxin system HicB family antitoxin [Chthonomonadales bacterium]